MSIFLWAIFEVHFVYFILQRWPRLYEILIMVAVHNLNYPVFVFATSRFYTHLHGINSCWVYQIFSNARIARNIPLLMSKLLEVMVNLFIMLFFCGFTHRDGNSFNNVVRNSNVVNGGRVLYKAITKDKFKRKQTFQLK